MTTRSHDVGVADGGAAQRSGVRSQEGAAVAWRSRITRHADVDPTTLAANPANWRQHPKHQADALSGVLSEVGYVQSVIVNERSGRIVDGHLRVALAVERSEPTVPVVYVDLADDEERLILAVLDPIGALAETDAAALSALLDGLAPRADGLADLLATLAPLQFAPGGELDGLGPGEALTVFEANTIRQVVLHYPVDEFAEVNDLLALLRDEYGEEANAAAVLRLLRERFDAGD